jgi:hypothetical protein
MGHWYDADQCLGDGAEHFGDTRHRDMDADNEIGSVISPPMVSCKGWNGGGVGGQANIGWSISPSSISRASPIECQRRYFSLHVAAKVQPLALRRAERKTL